LTLLSTCHHKLMTSWNSKLRTKQPSTKLSMKNAMLSMII